MDRRTLIAAVVGTLVFAVAMWFALLAIATSESIGIGILAFGLVLTMYSLAGYSGTEAPFDVGFKASIFALIVGGVLAVSYEVTGTEMFLVLSPLVAAGIGGAYAIAPVDERPRRLARFLASVPVGIVAGFVYTVDPLIYGVLMPLLPIPALLIADRIFDRGRAVVAEDPHGGTG